MLIRSLRRGLRLLTMLAIIISVLVACNTGDTPIALQPITQTDSPEPITAIPGVDLPSPAVLDPYLAQLVPDGFTLSRAAEFSQLLTTQPLHTHLHHPYGVAFDGSNVVVAEFGSGVRVIPLAGGNATSLGAGQLGQPRGVAVDGADYIVTDSVGGILYRLPGSGGAPVEIARGLGKPFSVAVESPGVYIVTDFIGGRLLRVSPGTVEVILGSGIGNPFGVAVDSPGVYWVTDLSGRRLVQIRGGSVSGTVTEGFVQPQGIEKEGPGTYIVGDLGTGPGQGKLLRVRPEQPQSVEVIFAGANPSDVALVSSGVFGVTDYISHQLLLVDEEIVSQGPSPSPQPGELTVEILNADEVDGQPLTIGETISLQAQATDPQGNDITAQIQWTDQEGISLGSGGVISYPAQETQMVTITASAGGTRDRVSTTISPSEVTVAPHVKVLSDQVADKVKLVDETAGIIRLADDELAYPTIRESDVVIGANALVPPMKVLGITHEEGDLVLSVQAASPSDVIKSGSATFEQETHSVTWRIPDEGITLADIPPKDMTLTLIPKIESFASNISPIRTQLRASATAGNIELNEQYEGQVIFGSDMDSLEVYLTRSAQANAMINFNAEGLQRWDSSGGFDIVSSQPKETVNINLGPVTVPVLITRSGRMDFSADGTVHKKIGFLGSHTGAEFQETIAYDSRQGWTTSAELMEDSWTKEIDEESEIFGGILVGIKAKTDIEILGQRAPPTSLNYYLDGLGAHESTKVNNSEPEGQLLAEIEREAHFALTGAFTYTRAAYAENSDPGEASLITESASSEDKTVATIDRHVSLNTTTAPVDNSFNATFWDSVGGELAPVTITPGSGTSLLPGASTVALPGQVVSSSTGTAVAVPALVRLSSVFAGTLGASIIAQVITAEPAGYPSGVVEQPRFLDYTEWPESIYEELLDYRTEPDGSAKCQKRIKNGQNLAWARFWFQNTVTGEIVAGILPPAYSGPDNRPGGPYTELVENPIYKPEPTDDGNDRETDSERKLIEKIHQILGESGYSSDWIGDLEIYSDFKICPSCSGIITEQFPSNFHRINVKSYGLRNGPGSPFPID